MKKTIGILAHVDAGKTTFSEQLLFQTNSIKQLGRVDHKNSFLDSHDIEKERGITIFSDVGVLKYKDSTYYLIDTPGHVDFSPEMERAIQVMDYAILLISASEGIEGHTETVWQLLRKYQIPTFFFINKTDRNGALVSKVIDEIRLNFSESIVYLPTAFTNQNLSTELIETIAESNEQLLEMYLNSEYDEKLWLKQLYQLIKDNKLFLCSSGSSLHNIGVMPFFEQFDNLTQTNYDSSLPFEGRVFKIRHDEKGVKWSYIKAMSGTLKVREEVCYLSKDLTLFEKITQMRIYNGLKYTAVNEVQAGDVFAVSGLTHSIIGTGIGCPDFTQFQITPTLTSKVIFDEKYNTKDVLNCFQLLEIEDPSLHVTWEETLKEIQIHVMGIIQLEVLEKVVLNRFLFPVHFGTPKILYKETIDTPVKGYGHYEPLRHYAEVHLLISKGIRGSGIVLNNECHPNDLAIGIQNNILHYLVESEHHGLLTGSPLTDVNITLLTGIYHIKHTSGGDFKEATLRALRHGLEKASNKLLEPFYKFKIKIELEYLGRVISDIQAAFGTFQPPEIMGNFAVLIGRVPVSTFMDYPLILASFTQGKGILNLTNGGYD